MRLSQLIQESGLADTTRLIGTGDPEIASVTDDSRAVAPNVVFVLTEQARSYLESALEKNGGPALVLATEEADVPGAPRVLFVPDLLAAQGALASALYGRPSEQLEIIGITGTNGKTSIACMLEHIWRESGVPYGIIGTLGVRYRGGDGAPVEFKTGYTTPRSPQLHEILGRMRDAGVTRVAMEVSSEGISLGRIQGIRFATAVFTNLTRDHLDHHGDMEQYYAAKAELFHQTARVGGRLIVYTGDEYGRRLADEMKHAHAGGAREITMVEAPEELSLPVPTGFNRINGTLALRAAGVKTESALRALKDMPAVPGRFNIVLPPWEDKPFNTDPSAGTPTRVFGIVDYAHTPDALENILREARELGITAAVCVVGCGGDRDPGKRAPMGRCAAKFAELVILTDDNPRTEDPEAIRRAMLTGVHQEWEHRMEEGMLPPEILEIGNRRFAIEAAVLWAMDRRGPAAVILAGKGHETEQIFANRREHFSDIEELEKAFLQFGESNQ